MMSAGVDQVNSCENLVANMDDIIEFFMLNQTKFIVDFKLLCFLFHVVINREIKANRIKVCMLKKNFYLSELPVAQH